MLAQRTSLTGPARLQTPRRTPWRRRPPAVLLALSSLPAGAGLTGCVSTQVRQAETRPATRCAITGTVVLVEPDIELVRARRRRHAGAAQGVDRNRAPRIPARPRAKCSGARASSLRPDFDLPKDAGPENRLRQLLLLNQAVSISILNYGRPGSALATSTASSTGRLGPGVAALREATGADYALFTYVRDSYTSGGRAAMRVIGFLLLGGDIGGGMQIGLASLVDLRTGQVVWYNLLLDQTGDLRDPAGARETAGDLLEGHPPMRRRGDGAALTGWLARRWRSRSPACAVAGAVSPTTRPAPRRSRAPTKPSSGTRWSARKRELPRSPHARARSGAERLRARRSPCKVVRRLLQGPARLHR